jgi:hypothetical protein
LPAWRVDGPRSDHGRAAANRIARAELVHAASRCCRRCPPVEASWSFAATLTDNEWPVDFVELAADHGSIAGPTYDRGLDRYSAADDPQVLAVAADVAARIAAVVGR